MLGWASWVQARRQYPIPVGPRADEAKAMCNATKISLGMIGGHVFSCSGARSLGCWGRTCLGMSGKKQCWRISVFLVTLSTSVLLVARRGGKMLFCHPFLVLVRFHISW